MEKEGVNYEPSLLVMSFGKRVKKQLIYNLSEKQFRMLNIATLRSKRVLCSMYGWLVLVVESDINSDHNDNDGDCCLFNPISLDIIKLPKLDCSIAYRQCILTKSPTDPDCYVLFNGIEQSFCQIGDEKYVTRTLEQQEEEEEENNYFGFANLWAIGSFQGQIYGFMRPDTFVTIHFVGKTIEFRIMPMEEPCHIPHSRGFYDNFWLIQSTNSRGTELLMVQKMYHFSRYYHERLDFNVFLIDTNRMSCIEVDNIGDRTIFLSEDAVGYCCPSMGTKSNSNYYTNIDDKNLYVFDLKKKSTISMLPSDVVAAKKPVSC